MKRKLNAELAIEKTEQGWHVYEYITDTYDLKRDPRGNHVMLDEDAMMEMAVIICDETGGCDLLKDCQAELEESEMAAKATCIFCTADVTDWPVTQNIDCPEHGSL